MYGKIFARFRNNLTQIMIDNQKAAAAYILEGQRLWQNPHPGEGANSWDGDPNNLSGANSILAAFKRDEINTQYVNALMSGGIEDGGRIADLKVCKTQGDYIAADERATTLKYASPIRCAMMASIRRQGQGHPVLGVHATIIKSLENDLTSGYNG